MMASPFAFYRGAALIMAADLATMAHTDLTVQLCGDAHLSNFGIFASPDRRLLFSVNDFDETLPGPFEWDLKRLVASVAIAGRSRGFTPAQRAGAVVATVRTYRESIRQFAATPTLALWYTRLDGDRLLQQFGQRATIRQRRTVDQAVARARSKDSLKAVKRLTHVIDGQRRFISEPPVVVPIEELVPPEQALALHGALEEVLASYRATLQDNRRHLLDRYDIVHLARKVVGVGSVGTLAWIVLMESRDTGESLVLQVKEAEESVLEEFLDLSVYDNHGHRVVAGQRLMQPASDIFLGWHSTTGIDGFHRDFYVRQLWDNKGSAVIEQMRPEGMANYGRICGWTLALAHARSGDAIGVAAYLGGGDVFDLALAEFAEAYADQNDLDYSATMQAVAEGRIHAVSA
jgi:hypothetical protein